MTLALGHYGPVHGGMPSAQRYESSQLVAMAIAVQYPPAAEAVIYRATIRSAESFRSICVQYACPPKA